MRPAWVGIFMGVDQDCRMPACFQPCPPAQPASPCCSTLPGVGLEATLPAGGWRLPTSVRNLDLSGNQIAGSLTPGFKLHDTLATLSLHNNPITGSIPAGLQLPAGLTTLALHDTQIGGTIPAGLRLPPTLATLNLERNLLEGGIPQALEVPASLSLMLLRGNRLRGGSEWLGALCCMTWSMARLGTWHPRRMHVFFQFSPITLKSSTKSIACFGNQLGPHFPHTRLASQCLGACCLASARRHAA